MNPEARCAMAEIVTSELILEHLKALGEDAKNARLERHEIRDEIRAMKAHLAGLVQRDLNRDGQQGNVFQRLERIERRLELTDAPAE
ncbi:MAG: hypothetical protein F4Z55_02695 [Boseongicola sp. SB0667_bin_21]|nr:hypothetical protein [Boseongicola sp. SB0667_bin_21]